VSKYLLQKEKKIKPNNTCNMFYENIYVIGMLLCFTLSSQNSYSQQQIQFSQLSKSFTNCILKDSNGFIWVGTQDGLLRYDNYNFKVFRYESNDKNSLPNNYIKDILEDKNRNLWIGTFGGGLVQWDRKQEKFYAFPIKTKSESIHSLQLVSDSILLIGSENGLIKFNIESKESTNISITEDEDASNFINEIYAISNEEVLIGTQNGLFQFNIRTSERVEIEIDEKITVHCIEGKYHRILIGTDKGLYVYNKRKSTLEKTLENKSISSILIIDNDQWYLGTNAGIGHYTKDNNYFWYTKNDETKNGLESDYIHTLYKVENDIIWAGTRQGVFQFSIRTPDFSSLSNQYSKYNCSTTALGMAEDKNKDIWICSRDGLMHIKTDGPIAQWTPYCYNISNTPGMKNSYTINITSDRYNDLWLAYRKDGISRLREVNDEWIWEDFPKVTRQLSGDGVNQVFQDLSGRYWIASRGLGLIRFFPEDEKLVFYNETNGLSHPYVFRIFQTQKNKLWLSTANGGLCLFDIEQEVFECEGLDAKNPSSLSANMVLSTSKNSAGKLLVCTVDGLNILEPDGSFTKINSFDGLPNNVIYSALEDDDGKIWLSTNEGISKIDLTREIPQITNYNKSHGLASYEFNQHAYLEHSSGLFLFGGVEGVSVFDPIQVEERKIIPKLAFTDFQLFNQSVPIAISNTSDYSLPLSINEIDKIELKYNQNSIGIEFAALGIATDDNTLYQYKLDGFESDWVNGKQRNFVAYPKLPHGDYVFKVRVADLNKKPISPEKLVQIVVSTPPWKTWWAYLLYFLVFVGLMYMISHIQKSRTLALTNARENERDVFRKKLARDFHDEAGNKITRISLITDSITRKSKETETVKTLNKLQDNIQDLRLGMTDFIWVLDPGKDTLSETLRRFMDFANETFEYTDIDFSMDPITDELKNITMESNLRRHFLLIMKEAITNLLKYSEASEVKFSYKKIEDLWSFSIADNGKGFNPETLTRINGINNMKSRAEKIKGSLEIISSKNKGTKVSLLVPLS